MSLFPKKVEYPFKKNICIARWLINYSKSFVLTIVWILRSSQYEMTIESKRQFTQ